MDDRTCRADGCDIPVPAPGGARGLCAKHYKRWKLYGDPLGRAEPTPETCAVEGCDKPFKAKGWCSGHYTRWLATGDVRADVPLGVRRYPADAQCAVEECERTPSGGGNGMCSMHYRRWQVYGDPLMVAFIRGDDRARIESKIDRSGGPDACHPWTAGHHVSGYGWTRVNDEPTLAHVAVWEFENGPKPPGIELDHECHNEAMRAGTCRRGICPHRLCCNLRHIVPRTKDEHVIATWYPQESYSHLRSGAA